MGGFNHTERGWGKSKGRSMKKKRLRILVVVLALLIVAGLVVWFYTPVGRMVSFATSVALGTEKTLEGEDANEAVTIAMKALSLSQGEQGFESWRLKANVASLKQDSGIIIAEYPNITYFRNENGKPVYVTAHFGEIDQEKQVMTLWDNVHITTDGKTLISSRMQYDDRKRVLTMPEPIKITTEDLVGTAKTASMDLASNVIEAHGDVIVEFGGMETTPESESVEKRP